MKLRMIFLLLTAVLLAACGLENVDVTVGEPERLGEQGVATAVPESKPTNPAPAEPADTKPSDTFMPKVNTFAEGDDPVWGDAFCPTTMPLCIRPFAIESQGNEQVLRVEMWGTGEIFAAGSEKLSINWRAFDNDGEGHTGNVCGRSTKRAASYQAGFGHLSHICFNMETRPNRLEIQVNGTASSWQYPWTPVTRNRLVATVMPLAQNHCRSMNRLWSGQPPSPFTRLMIEATIW